MKISMISAIGANREIGLGGKLLWHIPEDFKKFKELTLGHHLVMGRKTYDSIGRPLPGRVTIVLSRSENIDHDNVIMARSIDQAIEIAKERGEEELFICGGQKVYEDFLLKSDTMYLSYVDFKGEADAFFPSFESKDWLEKSSESFEKTGKTLAWKFKVFLRNR